MSINRRVGILIAHLRQLQGITQDQLAGKVGCTQSTISMWETGVRGYAYDLDLLAKIVSCLGYSLSDFFCIIEEKITTDETIAGCERILREIEKRFRSE